MASDKQVSQIYHYFLYLHEKESFWVLTGITCQGKSNVYQHDNFLCLQTRYVITEKFRKIPNDLGSVVQRLLA